MPITVELRENGRVIYAVFTYPYTLAEAVTGRDEEQRLRDHATGSGVIHSLINLSGSIKAPSGVLRVARYGPSFTHPTRGKVTIVGASLFGQTISKMAAKLAQRPMEIYFFRTEDEAWAFLRKTIAQEAQPVAG
ncbi:MAG TPA: hypothetical protein VKQ72_17545 [Aggregatilineales bacterium]|nr:hypothetical protein [Aggregatilineales bacterium]